MAINIPEILVANGAGMILMLLILFYSHRTFRIGLPDEKMFYGMVVATCFLCFVEITTYLIDGKQFFGARFLNYFLNELLFSLNTCFACLWIFYADYKIFRSAERLKRIFPINVIPACVFILLYATNSISGIFFTVSPDNIYKRGPLVVFAYLMTYAYLFGGMTIIYKNRRHAQRYMYMPAIVFILPVLFGSSLQFFFYGISTVWLSNAIGITALYISLQSDKAYIDRLTGVYNRHYLETYLDAIYRHNSDKNAKVKSLIGLMIDIDKFKLINDRFGHIVGDDALFRTAHLLRTKVGKSAFVARFGGDEFMVLLRDKTEKDIHALINVIHKAVETENSTEDRPYTLQLSVGYAIVNPSDSTKEEFLHCADQAMYAAKRKKAAL